jgi:hypothetical protein
VIDAKANMAMRIASFLFWEWDGGCFALITLWLSEEPGRVLRGARMRYAPFSSVTDGDWKVYAVDIMVMENERVVCVC